MIERVIADDAAAAVDQTSMYKGADGKWTDDAGTPVLPGADADAKGLAKAISACAVHGRGQAC
jgi:hypothetical protein